MSKFMQGAHQTLSHLKHFGPSDTMFELKVRSARKKKNYNCIYPEEEKLAQVLEQADCCRIRTEECQCASVSEFIAFAAASQADYIFRVAPKDRLTEVALAEVTLWMEEKFCELEGSGKEMPALVYTDRWKPSDERPDVFLPDFAPKTLEAGNYIGGSFAVNRRALLSLTESPENYESGGFYGIIFRLSTAEGGVVHIPMPLVISQGADGTPEEEETALYDWFKETGRKADPIRIPGSDRFCIRYELTGQPLISIVIPNKDQKDILARCIDSIREKSTYGNYEILIAENNSEKKETFAYYESLKEDPRIRVLPLVTEWNYSHINNEAVKEAKGEYLLFLNNDTEVIEPCWLEWMLGLAQQPEVGAVGARLLFPDGTIQHAGVCIGIRGVAGHSFRGWDQAAAGYCDRILSQQNLSAVTAACMLVPKEVFDRVGGFDEDLAVAFNDTDLCMKIRKLGYEIVYSPDAQLLHYESKSRGTDEHNAEKLARFNRESLLFQKRWWKELVVGDPYYNPNLSTASDDFETIDLWTQPL